MDDYLGDDDPWLFRTSPRSYIELKQAVHRSLGATDTQCLIVGSAKFGYSVSPDRFGHPFTAGSDVDIAVISAELFDAIWSAMLEWHYPWHVRKWHVRQRAWARSYLEDHFVGSITPDRIRVESYGRYRVPRPIQPIANRWFDTFKRIGAIEPVRGHDANARLFRTMTHLVLYQRWGLRNAKQQLAEERA